jgi:RND superfamily putative drug exporter
MRALASLVAGRRGKWIVFAVWIAAFVGTLAAQLPAKFTDAEENSSTSFLPGDAESTSALRVTEQLNEGDVAPTVIVYRRADGLTPQDRTAIAQDRDRLNAATREFANTTPFAEPQPSRDGTAVLVQNQIKGTGESAGIIDPVERYRELVSEGRGDRGGLAVSVTGPAGVSADAIKVFENINGTLVGAAFLLVIVLLILIYRSPVFWLFPILAVVVAEIAARGFGYGLTEIGVTVNGQSSSILSVLVIGAGTDYALLLVSRYREELRQHQDKHLAMRLAVERAGPAILASGLTVCIALLALTLAKVNGTAGLGPTGAMGVAVAMLVMLTFLPALLTIVGRRRFWPFVPYGPEGAQARDHTPMRPVAPLRPLVARLGPVVTFFVVVLGLAGVASLAGGAVGTGIGQLVAAGVVVVVGRVLWPRLDRRFLRPFELRRSVGRDAADETHGFWRRVGDRVAARPAQVAAITTVVLLVMALGLLNFSTGLTQGNSFRDDVESIQGQELIAQSFPQGQSAPTDIVLPADARGAVPAVARAAAQVEGVAAVPPQPVRAGAPGIQLNAFLQLDPYSTEAFDVIPELRSAVREVAPQALVGGPTAVEYDLREAATRDTLLLIPLILAIVLVILVALLRSLVAPLLLIATVVLSFLAALGVGAVVFDVIFGFPGSDSSLPLFAFLFLVALGVDYNIFLMARVREEAHVRGTREGMLRGLAVTGGVITSAGVVLAGTFAVLGVLPLVFLTQIGFVVAFGVLLDTFIVRSVLVPALVLKVGPKVWWPSPLAREDGRGGRPPGPPHHDDDDSGNGSGNGLGPRGNGHAALDGAVSAGDRTL